MSQSQTNHALSVVEAFKEKLSKSALEHVGQKHFDELALLIESAIDSSVFIEMEKVANRIDVFAKDVRNSAEKFD